MTLRSAALLHLFAAVLPLAAAAQSAVAHPRDAEINAHDSDTREWWHTTEFLSSDAMEGRDTGSAAYGRAAHYLARRFAAAGLKPMGDAGSYLQRVPMHQIDVVPSGTSLTVSRAEREPQILGFLTEWTVGVSASMRHEARGSLVFRGYCGADTMGEVRGKVVVCFGTQRAGLPGGGERYANAVKAGAAAVITVDDPYFSIEPPRWPWAYARSVTLRPSGSAVASASPTAQPPSVRLSDAAFSKLLSGSGQDAAAILKAGGAQQPLQNSDLPGVTLELLLHTTESDISSQNVIGFLPGSDPKLSQQVVVVSAHLDGYGYGTPVAGDSLYNGALDDAAYVALLIQMADDLQHGKLLPMGADPAMRRNVRNIAGLALSPPGRSLLFCAFTGEEKGLLGSTWFVAHPTVPHEALAADINLDQLRPLFPLRILTVPGVERTTLGETAKVVGAADGIEIRSDREPERHLLMRADNWPFLRSGVPAIGFVFGFDSGSSDEVKYREWYRVRYHRPQDDVTQPMDFGAAVKFNNFFYHLVETVADAPERPRVLEPAK